MKSREIPIDEVNKLETEQSVSNVDQFTPPAVDSLLQRLEILEDILCSSQKSLTESQAIAKINDLVEASKNMELTLSNLQEKYIDLHAKQSNYKTTITNINRVKKNQQLLGSRLDLLENKREQDDGYGNSAAEQFLESRIKLLEEALFSVQAFEPNAQLIKEMKDLSEKNKAAEVKNKFLQKKLADTHANQVVLRVDLDNLDRRTASIREDLDSMNNTVATKILALKEKNVSIASNKKNDNQEQNSMNNTTSPTQSSEH
ncbi:uncharacterized protein ATC70_004885 [Mucor velutinosus]|uniref:Uncharacterized protein n=1 Tax=Mucor velutinosus TaxID=708070 RepID=A0AAN7HQQ0_9FUNG|nr:hypothetical protein ATC70_004885 [Mucor velutinosus]